MKDTVTSVHSYSIGSEEIFFILIYDSVELWVIEVFLSILTVQVFRKYIWVRILTMASSIGELILFRDFVLIPVA
jgi:hypothetical protein